MAKKTVDVKKIREIIRLSKTSNIGQRRIARELNIPRLIVAQYLNDLSASELTYEQTKSITDDQILTLFEKQKTKITSPNLKQKMYFCGMENLEVNTPYPVLSRIEFIERIHQRQKKIRNFLEISDYGLSVWTKTPGGKTLSRGCQSCKSGRWQCLFVGKKCNVDCVYCPQGTRQEKIAAPERPGLINDSYKIEDIKSIFNRSDAIWSGKNIQGIGYSGGEPFLYLDKVFDLAKFISKYHDHIYQWIYTNGLLVTEDKLKAVYDSGVKEVRFHLGATDFNKEVLKKIELAKKIMDYVNVETPSNPELKEFLIDKKGLHLLEDIGVYQINLGELSGISIDEMERFPLGFKRALEYFQQYELYLYDSMIGKSVDGKNLSQIYISPTISREITYDIMQYAVDNKIDILINDCSQDAKYIQRFQKNLFEHHMDALITTWFQNDEYVQMLQENINEQKLNLMVEHTKPQKEDWVKMLILKISYKDERGYHFKLGDLKKSFNNLSQNF
jgi:pyruvate formate-lyase activating enzyme-like uncharacterized protein/predicted transcriptional regulator